MPRARSAQIESAFKTTLRNYRHDGQTVRQATSALSIPRSISSSIAGIIGVSSAPLRHPATQHRLPDPTRRPADAQPPRQNCSTYWDQYEQIAPLAYGKTSFPTNNCGYSAAQLRTAYGVQSAVSHGNNGHGVTVAIIDAYASATMLADANALSVSQGEPPFATGQYTETDLAPFDLQNECGPDGWNEEESLDVEAVHGMAPGANVHYVGAADCAAGIDDAVNFVLQNHVANLVSNSYGFAGEDGLGDEVALEHSEFLQAALQGVGFYFSSGDDGDNVGIGAPHPEPDYPSSDPLVTGVGGTSLAVTKQNGYLFETSWGDDLSSVNFATSPSSYVTPPPGSFVFGGGGGVSALFGEPLYQRLAVPGSLARLNGSTPMRVVPDVAAVGDPETGLPHRLPGNLADHRWHEPVRPGVRRHPGPGEPGTPLPDRLRQSAAVRALARSGAVPRRSGAGAHHGADDPVGTQPAHHGPGFVADLYPGVRRHHGPWHSQRSGTTAGGASAALTATPYPG